METTEFTIKKSTITSYKIRSNDLAWADINIDANGTQGRIQIASDYGSWQNFWGACGCSFNEFLAGLNIDYFAGKVGANKWFDLPKTIKYLKERVYDVEDRTKEQVETLLNEISRLNDSSGKDEFVHIMHDCDAVMLMECHCPEMIYSIEPSFQRFWDEIWPVFVAEISKVKTDKK